MLIALSGLKGSGKDTAALVLIRDYGFTKIAFADAVREMALVIDPYVLLELRDQDMLRLSEIVESKGWDWAKREISEVRRLLQVIGTEAGRMLFGPNVWIDLLLKRFPDLADPDTRYVVTDCRFENEAEFVQSLHGDICWVARPGVVSDGHASETDVVKKYATKILVNDETIEELQEDVRFMMFLRGF